MGGASTKADVEGTYSIDCKKVEEKREERWEEQRLHVVLNHCCT